MSGLSSIMKAEEQKYTQSYSKHKLNTLSLTSLQFFCVLIANPRDVLKHQAVPDGLKVEDLLGTAWCHMEILVRQIGRRNGAPVNLTVMH